MIDKTFHTPLPFELEVAIPAGAIEIETVDGEESSIVVEGDEELLEHVEITQSGNRVLVALRGKSKFGFFVALGSHVFGNAGIRVRAGVPHGAAVKVKTAAADVRVDGRLEKLDVNSVSGDVVQRGEIAGRAVVKTVSGDIALEHVGGDLSAQTVSGDLRSGPVGGSIEAKSVSGDLRLAAATAGDVRFASVSGDVEIGITPGSALDVDAGSTSGDLSSEVPLGSDGPNGDDAAAPTVVVRGRTVSGDVRVFRA